MQHFSQIVPRVCTSVLFINKAFKECSISNAFDGSEDSMIYEDYSDDESDSDPFADIDGEADEDMPQDDI